MMAWGVRRSEAGTARLRLPHGAAFAGWWLAAGTAQAHAMLGKLSTFLRCVHRAQISTVVCYAS